MDDASDAELRAVFAPRADSYLAHWRGTAKRHLNWAAVFFSGFWLAYRRLYRATLFYWGFLYISTLVEQAIFAAHPHPQVERWVDRVITLFLAGLCGVFGNEWYLARVRRVLAATRALALQPDQHLRELTRRGGTRVSHAIAALLLFAVAGFATAFVAAAISEQ